MDSDTDIEDLVQAYEQFSDKQRRALGLPDIAQAAHLNPEQTSFLEQTLLNPSPLPPQVRVPSPLLVQLLLAIRQFHDRGVAVAALHERETAARRSTQQLWASGLLLAAVLTATLTFSNETVIPDTDGSLYREHATWWGFVRQSQELRWMKSDEYSDEPMWMLRRPDGRWKPYQMMTPFHELEESSIGAR